MVYHYLTTYHTSWRPPSLIFRKTTRMITTTANNEAADQCRQLRFSRLFNYRFPLTQWMVLIISGCTDVLGCVLEARKLLSLAFICFDLTENFVNDVRDRCGGVDYNPVFRNAFISRSSGLPPQSVGSSATRSSIRRREVSRSTSRTNTPSKRSMNLG